MTKLQPGSDPWLAQVREEPIEPEQPIIDPHHHLWKNRFGRDYLLPEFHRDTGGGHNIVKSVFMECRAFWLREGPEHLRPTGETRHIADLARRSESGPNEKAPRIAGIVAHADLRLAATAKLGELLDAHEAVCGGRLRGIRQCAALDRAAPLFIDVQAPAGLYADADFRAGLRMLAARNLTFDAWHYHHQMRDFIDLAQALPECTFVL
ncbi:MAG: amidohydrolase, partial [Gammaproteobacteria bacterium]|nr:amidohydrolase [Gammaproteobacteria bacterium]